MRVSVTDAKARLTSLVRLAEAGGEVILTRHGEAIVRLTPAGATRTAKNRREILEAIRASGAAKSTDGPSAARSQDFLYGDDGLPE
jgi:prevent-host-death family protein